MANDDAPKTLADALRSKVLNGTRAEWYDGQRAQYQREDAERQAALEREADRQIEQLKKEGRWPGYERR